MGTPAPVGPPHPDPLFPPPQCRGRPGLGERWVLSRLSRAVGVCGGALGGFDFPAATSAVHGFWLYELCDVYLVRGGAGGLLGTWGGCGGVGGRQGPGGQGGMWGDMEVMGVQ